jgi:hypothetical protein
MPQSGSRAEQDLGLSDTNLSTSPTPSSEETQGYIPAPSTGALPEPAGEVQSGGADPVAAESAPALGDTAGTGTILAIGCIGGTLFLIVLGLIYLGVTQLFG